MKRFSKEALKKFLARWIKETPPESASEPHRVSAPLKERTLVEGISGTWYYHLSNDGRTALCGARVMPTGSRESTWKKHYSDLGERYCSKCDEICQAVPHNELHLDNSDEAG
jgi:hypothetical protein